MQTETDPQTMTTADCSSKASLETASTASELTSSSTCLSAGGRSIRLCLENNQVFSIDDDYQDIDLSLIWFTGDEYSLIKAKSREESRQWRRQGYGVLIKETFESHKPDVQDYLNAFCKLEGELSRRGLERHLSRQHAEERSDHKDCARQAVFMTQARLSRKGVKGEEVVERIAQAYEQQCRHSKIFARRLGIADELVVREGEDSALAEKIMGGDGGSGHRKMERRLSNYSTVSANSLDSRRRWAAAAHPGMPGKARRCPSSPASAMEEYYAAIA